MEFNFRAIEQITQGGNFGRNHEFPGNQIDPREKIMREMEKAKIREQIMAEELMRKRALEAEVRMEIMVERQIALRTGRPFSYLPEASGSDSRIPIFDQLQSLRSLEERIAVIIDEKIGSLIGAESLPFQRSVEPTITEVAPVPVNKETVVPLVMPNGNQGQKRKAVTPLEVGPTDLIIKKRKLPKEEWSCAICQVSAANEHLLNKHLSGKNHKSKAVALKSPKKNKKFGIGLIPKEFTSKSEGKKEIYKKNEEKMKVVLASEQKSAKPAKKKRSANDFKFWCEMCEVGARNERDMEGHRSGKRHKKNLEEISSDAGDKVLSKNASLEQITKVNSDAGERVPMRKVSPTKVLLDNVSPQHIFPEQFTKVNIDSRDKVSLDNVLLEKVLSGKTLPVKYSPEKVSLEQSPKVNNDTGNNVLMGKVPPNFLTVKVLPEKVLPERVLPQNLSPEQSKKVNSDSRDKVPVEKVLWGKVLPAKLSRRRIKKLKSEMKILKKDGADRNIEDELKQKLTKQAKKKKLIYWCEMCDIGAYCERTMESHKNGKKHINNLTRIAKVSCDARDKVWRGYISLENILAGNVSPGQIMRVSDSAQTVPPENALAGEVLHAGDKVLLEDGLMENTSPENILLENASPENTMLERVSQDNVSPEQITKVNSDSTENALVGEVLHAGDKILLDDVSPENVLLENTSPVNILSEKFSPENVSPAQITKIKSDAGDKVPPENALPGKVLHGGNNVLPEYVFPEDVAPEIISPEQIMKVNSGVRDKVPPENASPEIVSRVKLLPENVEKPESKHNKDDNAFWCLICEEGCQNFSMWTAHTNSEMHIEKLIKPNDVTGTENGAAGDKSWLYLFGSGNQS